MAEAGIVIILIVSFIAAIFIVNFLQRLLMRIMDIDMMGFSLKGKIIVYVVVAFLIAGLIMKIFNIS